jgi:hypothetical protein
MVDLRLPKWHEVRMKATTIKLEGEFLEELKAAKPDELSLTAYVRGVLRRDVERRNMEEAAMAYRAFVESEPAEKEWLKEWDRADLATAPRVMEDHPS